MRGIFILPILTLALGCASFQGTKQSTPTAADTERVVVTAVLQDGERVLARPQIMVNTAVRK